MRFEIVLARQAPSQARYVWLLAPTRPSLLFLNHLVIFKDYLRTLRSDVLSPFQRGEREELKLVDAADV